MKSNGQKYFTAPRLHWQRHTRVRGETCARCTVQTVGPPYAGELEGGFLILQMIAATRFAGREGDKPRSGVSALLCGGLLLVFSLLPSVMVVEVEGAGVYAGVKKRTCPEVSRTLVSHGIFRKPKPYWGLLILFVAACSALRGVWHLGYMQRFFLGSLWVVVAVVLIDCGLGLLFFGDLGQVFLFLFGTE